MATKGITVDDKFLRSFLEKGGVAATPTGTPVVLESESLPTPTTSPDVQTKRVRTAVADRQQEQDENAQASGDSEDKARIAELRKAKQEERDASIEEAQQREQLSAIKQGVDTALAPAKQIADRVASARTVGGIGSLLVILAILMFAIVPVNAAGDTRLKQIWYMFNGRATLQGRKIITPNDVNTQDAAAITTLGTDVANVIGDIGTITADAVTNAATGDITGFLGTIGNDFGQLFRNIP